MEIVTWFGIWDPEGLRLLPHGNLEDMIDALDSRQASPIAGGEALDLRAIAKGSGIVREDAEYDSLLREVAMGLVRRRLARMADAEADLLQMIEALDDLNEAVNLLDERLYEWSRLGGDRARGPDLAEALFEREGIGELAGAVLELRSRREALEAMLATTVNSLAPNLADLAGPLLAARLISRAGSLKRLSELPSSAIQLMGAEKSLFKHLRGKATSPKHGIIFRHPAVFTAPRALRGKVSRALAGKLAIAARIDYHSGSLDPTLKGVLEARLAEIRDRPRKRRTRPR